MATSVSCQGAPRDLGLDQGAACAAWLRRRFAQRPWWERALFLAGIERAERERLRRDLERHFPHQYETLAGLAVGGQVPPGWLVDELARELAAREAEPPDAVGVAAGAGLLARRLDGEWLVRRSRPEGLFASVEVTRPWLTAALAGVNSAGLAVLAVAEGGETGTCAAPAALLAQDCLERFEVLEAALEWCLGRPGGGRATLLLADRAGDVAAVEVSGDERRVRRPTEGVWLADGTSSRSDELAKRLRGCPPRDVAALAGCLGGEVAALDSAAAQLSVAGAVFSP